jgi:uncharacterized membrane protein
MITKQTYYIYEHMMVLKIDSFLLVSLMQKAFKTTFDTLNFG